MRLIMLIVLASLAMPGVQAATSYVPQDKALQDEFEARFGKSVRTTWNENTLQSLIGPTTAIADSLISPGKVLEALGRFLGVDANHLQIDGDRTVKYEDGAHYEFHQTATVGGQPVENALLIIDVVRDKGAPDGGGRLVGVGSQLVPQLDLLGLPDKPDLSQDAAECIAAADFLQTPVAPCDQDPQKHIGAGKALVFEVYPTLFAVPPFARPAWVVELRQQPQQASRRYVIDRTNHGILEMRDRSHEAGPHGRVFNPTPFTDGTVKTYADVAQTCPAYQEIDPLPDLKNAMGTYRLANDLIAIIDYDHVDDVAKPDGNFDFLRGSMEFASVMAYYHIDTLERYAFSVPGVKQRASPLPVDVRSYKSKYMNEPPGVGYLLFYSASRFLAGTYRDFFEAEDGDIVAHECGHAIQASQAGGRYDHGDAETLAMFEGFGDYWAMSYFEKQKVEHQLDPTCLGRWKERWAGNASDGDCSRRVNLAAMFDKDFDPKSNDVYKNASVWTATLWDIRRQFGRPVADAIIVRSHLSVLDSPTFVQGAQAIFAADDALYFGQGHGPALCDIFMQRKILTTPDDCKPGSLPPPPPPASPLRYWPGS
jgi:hypothetical protein